MIPRVYANEHRIVYTTVTDHRVISDRMCAYDMCAYYCHSNVTLTTIVDGGRGAGLERNVAVASDAHKKVNKGIN